MKAVRIHDHGQADALVYEEAPEPALAGGQVLLRVEAAGVNYIDVYHRTGLYSLGELPLILGVEAAGVVERVGAQVEHLRVGDRVAFAGPPGSYADKVAVPAERAVPIPDGISSEVAAAAMLQGMTAHYLTRSTFALAPRHTCLVHAAAGGVGLLLCQMARQLGARVIATVSTSAKAALAHEAGADDVILYEQKDFETETRRLTSGAGVDVVYDGIGRSTFDRSLRCLRPRGMMVLFGQASGPVPPFDLSLLSKRGSLFVTRPSLFAYIASRSELLQRAQELFEEILAGRLRVRVDAVLPLSEAKKAHEALEGRRTVGKLLLRPESRASL
jgi:NADPH2:quinone reductase